MKLAKRERREEIIFLKKTKENKKDQGKDEEEGTEKDKEKKGRRGQALEDIRGMRC